MAEGKDLRFDELKAEVTSNLTEQAPGRARRCGTRSRRRAPGAGRGHVARLARARCPIAVDRLGIRAARGAERRGGLLRGRGSSCAAR